MRRLTSAALLVLCMAASSAFAIGRDETSIEQALNARLASITSLSARFTQTTIDASNRTLQEGSGRLWVARPSRFRIETTRPSVQTLVSDGTDFWTWDADLEQVTVKKLDRDVKQIPILLLGGDTSRILRDYRVSFYTQDNTEHYVLKADSPASLFETLGIEFAGAVPRTITITDSLGQETRIRLTDVAINGQVDAARFSFKVPAGADVIDDRGAH